MKKLQDKEHSIPFLKDLDVYTEMRHQLETHNPLGLRKQGLFCTFFSIQECYLTAMDIISSEATGGYIDLPYVIMILFDCDFKQANVIFHQVKPMGFDSDIVLCKLWEGEEAKQFYNKLFRGLQGIWDITFNEAYFTKAFETHCHLLEYKQEDANNLIDFL